MPGKDIADIRIERQRTQCGRLYLEGKDPSEIALIVGIKVAQVMDNLRLVREGWIGRYQADYDEKVAEELARIHHIERTAWAAWERSTGNTVRTSSKHERVVVNRGSKEKPVWEVKMRETERSKVETSSAGNPKFLAVIADCVMMRAKITGMMEPDTIQQNTQVNINWDSMAIGNSSAVTMLEQSGVDGNGQASAHNTLDVVSGDTIPSSQSRKLGSLSNKGGVGIPGGSEIDPIEARINAIQPVPKPVSVDIPLIKRRDRGDEITTGDRAQHDGRNGVTERNGKA